MATVLVQSELERWTNGDRSKERGAVFTPSFLAEWVAALLRETCDEEYTAIADFGCGSGNLLTAAAKQFPSRRLLGIEIDQPSVTKARSVLGQSASIIAGDFLSPAELEFGRLADHWLNRLGTQPEALIMNPPWGADHAIDRAAALTSGLTLAWGQFDTYDLFCELALQILKPNGAYAFIIPDSVFLPEHQRLRELLAEKTTISLIARLGEGIFSGVYRGCVVIIGKLTAPINSHKIECVRLRKMDRVGLQDSDFLDRCRKRDAHWVPQARFLSDPLRRFDIDVSVSDETIARVLDRAGDWTSPLNSRRGVELSKSGRVIVCEMCGTARPLPKDISPECLQCRSILRRDPDVIVAQQPSEKGVWKQFIVGEDVRRYEASSRRWIRTDLRGINYKRNHPEGTARVLVRKTGIGLNAALDLTGALTNQVVFEYTLTGVADFNFSYLHYILGVLCSRTLLAVHLKRGGDLEWRSHPYVTQKTLAELPIPLPQTNTRQWFQAAAIAGAVEEHLAGADCDLRIEALVAGLYELSPEDMQWVAGVLCKAGDLELIKNLRLPVDQVIEPITVH